MHRTVVFRSEWENEPSENEESNPPGEALAEALVQAMGKLGVSVGRAEPHSYYGWSFIAHYERCYFDVVLNPADDCYLTISSVLWCVDVLLGRRPRRAFRRFCDLVRSALDALEGVSHVRWQGE